jgi:predicted transcriptional regulator
VAVGVITDRDICMGAHLTGRALHELRVADSMSRQLFACASSDPIEQVIRVMGDQRVRRVPVLDGQGKPVGIVSLNDVVRRLVALTDDRTRSRLTVRLIEALASICETRTAQAVPEVMPPRADAPAPVLAG